jgi:hypothetical protein
VTDRLSAAALAFVAALDDPGRARALAPFDAEDRREWTYLPGARPGVAVEDLDDRGRELLDGLLSATLSSGGADRAREVMMLDDVLRDLEQVAGRSGWERRSSGRYWVRVLGDPAGEVWAWRLGGHHVAVHATVVGDTLATTPCFLGANPAVVPRGPQRGRQVLREEEALARSLLGALDADQLAAAVVSPTAPSDIATRHDPVADLSLVPPGLPREQLDTGQRRGFDALVRCYVDRARDDVAANAWRALVDEGLDALTFAWCGPTEVGGPHYYALKGESFLVEYDNTQDGANHVHTVWRDRRGDWGEDLLARHHAADHR